MGKINSLLHYNLLFLLVLMAAGCGENKYSLEPAEYVRWVEDIDNGLKTTKSIDELTFTIQYKPYEYIAAKELKKVSVKQAELDKIASEIKGLQYFNLTIKNNASNQDILRKDLQSDIEYQQRVSYYSFEMQNDITFAECNDTLRCSLFHFERTFGVAPYITFLLGFPTIENTNANKPEPCDKTIIIEENVFNNGKVILTIDKENLVNIPKIITD